MKKDKEVQSQYDYCRNIVGYESRPIPEDRYKPVDPDLKPEDSLLRIVYAEDPRTGLPTGDLEYLVSDKANPDVKEFILAHLMQDVSAAQNVAAKLTMSDDDILALSMNPGESVQAYAERLNTSIKKDLWMINSVAPREKQVESDPSE